VLFSFFPFFFLKRFILRLVIESYQSAKKLEVLRSHLPGQCSKAFQGKRCNVRLEICRNHRVQARRGARELGYWPCHWAELGTDFFYTLGRGFPKNDRKPGTVKFSINVHGNRKSFFFFKKLKENNV
jgi:hypothetical protein